MAVPAADINHLSLINHTEKVIAELGSVGRVTAETIAMMCDDYDWDMGNVIVGRMSDWNNIWHQYRIYDPQGILIYMPVDFKWNDQNTDDDYAITQNTENTEQTDHTENDELTSSYSCEADDTDNDTL
jgi:hypothetical protein